MADSECSDAAELVSAWDRFLDGASAANDEPFAVVARLHALDRRETVPSPEPAFVRSLEVRLMRQPLAGSLPRAVAATPQPLAHGPAGTNERSPSLAPRGRRWSFASLATAAIVVLTLAATWLAFRAGSPDGDDEQPASAVVRAFLPVRPDPSECQVAPLTPREAVRLASTPAARSPVSSSIYEPRPLHEPTPVGIPADPDIVEAITATMIEYYACLNAGNRAAQYALLSDEAIRTTVVSLVLRHGQDPTTTYAYGELLGSGIPQARSPLDRVSLLDVREVKVLSDGRVWAVIVDDNSARLENSTFRRPVERVVIFKWEDGRYRIDTPNALGIVVFAPGCPPSLGTPVASPVAQSEAVERCSNGSG